MIFDDGAIIRIENWGYKNIPDYKNPPNKPIMDETFSVSIGNCKRPDKSFSCTCTFGQLFALIHACELFSDKEYENLYPSTSYEFRGEKYESYVKERDFKLTALMEGIGTANALCLTNQNGLKKLSITDSYSSSNLFLMSEIAKNFKDEDIKFGYWGGRQSLAITGDDCFKKFFDLSIAAYKMLTQEQKPETFAKDDKKHEK